MQFEPTLCKINSFQIKTTVTSSGTNFGTVFFVDNMFDCFFNWFPSCFQIRSFIAAIPWDFHIKKIFEFNHTATIRFFQGFWNHTEKLQSTMDCSAMCWWPPNPCLEFIARRFNQIMVITFDDIFLKPFSFSQNRNLALPIFKIIFNCHVLWVEIRFWFLFSRLSQIKIVPIHFQCCLALCCKKCKK